MLRYITQPADSAPRCLACTQWMADHPKHSLEEVRRIVAQVAKGLQAFYRREMLHGDLRPENLMIDHTGTVMFTEFKP